MHIFANKKLSSYHFPMLFVCQKGSTNAYTSGFHHQLPDIIKNFLEIHCPSNCNRRITRPWVARIPAAWMNPIILSTKLLTKKKCIIIVVVNLDKLFQSLVQKCVPNTDALCLYPHYPLLVCEKIWTHNCHKTDRIMEENSWKKPNHHSHGNFFSRSITSDIEVEWKITMDTVRFYMKVPIEFAYVTQEGSILSFRFLQFEEISIWNQKTMCLT